MFLGTDLEEDQEGTFAGTLTHPWWEMAGRLALGLWLGPTGLVMTAGALQRLLRGGNPQSLSLVVMGSVGTAMLWAAIQGARGRFRAAGLVVGVMLALALIFMVLPSKRAPAVKGFSWRWHIEFLLDMAALAWILVRARAQAGGSRPALKAAAGALLGLFVVHLPVQAASLGGSLGALTWPESAPKSIDIGQRFPKSAFRGLDGGEVSLEQRGVLYIVTFWATWCSPCLEELPKLKEMAEGWPPDAPVRLIAVNIEEMESGDLRNWIETKGLSGLAVATDPQRIQEAVGAQVVPFTLLVRDRTVLARHQGFGGKTIATLRKEIEELLSGRVETSSPGASGPRAAPSR